MILQFYKRPLEKLLTKEEIDSIFLTAEALFWYHLDFYQSIANRDMKFNSMHLANEIHHFVKDIVVGH